MAATPDFPWGNFWGNKGSASPVSEVQDTICGSGSWPAFEAWFGTKPGLIGRFDQLAGLRNSIRHSRTATDVTRKDGEAAILWFEEIIKSRAGSDTVADRRGHAYHDQRSRSPAASRCLSLRRGRGAEAGQVANDVVYRIIETRPLRRRARLFIKLRNCNHSEILNAIRPTSSGWADRLRRPETSKF